MKKNVFHIIFNIIITIASVVLSWVAPFYLWLSILVSVICPISCIVAIVFRIKNNKYYSFVFTFNCLVVFFVVLFTIFFFTGLIEHFRDIESAREWFASFGIIAWLVLFLIQLLQVVVLPIPAQITTVAGVLIFGALQCFFISSVAVILGSIICFAIGKWLGVKVAYKLASKELVDKYRKLLNKKGKVLLPLAFLLPCFPDDLLCFIAGATTMTYRYFIITTLLTRIVGVAGICFLGSGDFIPFSGWGIPVLIVIAIVSVIIAILFLKYQDNIEEWVINKVTKKGKKDDENSQTENNESLKEQEKTQKLSENEMALENSKTEKIKEDKKSDSSEKQNNKSKEEKTDKKDKVKNKEDSKKSKQKPIKNVENLKKDEEKTDKDEVNS